MLKKFEPSARAKMETKTDLVAAREYFLKKKNRVLYNLVKDRYSWMNDYISPTDTVIYELGCGTGISKEFIKNPNLKLTDVIENDWVDEKIDALNLPMPDGSVDVFILCNVLHHFAYPLSFLKQAAKKLKTASERVEENDHRPFRGGRILLFEPYTSFVLKIAQKTLDLEGWDDNADVYDETTPCNDPNKPWSANDSIPKLLFFNRVEKLQDAIPILSIKKRELCEFLTFVNSGGVNYHTFHLPIGDKGYYFMKKIDGVLVKIFPNLCAMGCKVVLEKGTNRA